MPKINKYMRLSLLIFCTISPLSTVIFFVQEIDPSTSSDQPVKRGIGSLSLEQAIKAATEMHPAIRSAETAINIAQFGESKALAGLMPNVTLQANVFGEKNNTDLRHSINISASQFIAGFNGPIQQKKRAAITTKKTRLSKDLTIQQYRQMAEDTFLLAWLKQEELALLKKYEETGKHVLAVKEKQFECNLLSRADLAVAQAEYTQVATALESYHDELVSLISSLEEVTGVSLIADDGCVARLVWNADNLVPLDTLESYLEKGLKNRLDLKIKLTEREEFLSDRDLAATAKLPKLGLFASYDRRGNIGGASLGTVLPFGETVTSPGSTEWYTGGLTLSWNLFDGMSSGIEADIARSKALKSCTEYEVLRRKATTEIKSAFSTVSKIEKKLTALKAEFVAAQQLFDLATARFSAGTITLAELHNATSKNYQSQFAVLGQTVERQRAVNALHATCGYQFC